MSDHVDGPRSIGDPTADVSDLFAFRSPENPARTVLCMCVFPSAGEDAVFSNILDHAIGVRRVRVAGVGSAAKFQAADEEMRFTVQFDVLTRDAEGRTTQHGVCKLPDGRTLPLIVNDEAGASTPEGDCRVFAGLRSDPFYLAWIIAEMKRVPNLLQHDNVLSIVIDVDTKRFFDPAKGSLFGAIAETIPARAPGGRVSHPVARIDWVGRAEQTNIRLSNPGLVGATDLRDLWNQQRPFAISKELEPLFRERLTKSFAQYDMRDGVADWTPEALAANVNVFLDDFLLFDVTKPTTDLSHLEIEKSTLAGRPYQTGGGRTIDANVIDILMTWLINHDREFLQGGATSATKRGMKVFPYLAIPNTELQTLKQSVELAAEPDAVWSVIGEFGNAWHPLVAKVRTTGAGIGQLRTVETVDGKEIVERLEAIDGAKRSLRYANVAGVAASRYTAELEVKPKGNGSVADWRVQFLANNQPDIVVKSGVSTLLSAGLESLKDRFGAP